MGLSATLQASIGYDLSGNADLGTVQAKYAGHASRELPSGVAAGQVDKLFMDTRTLASNTAEDLDLSGALVDPIGGTAVFAKVRGIIVKSKDTNTTNLTIKPGASNGFTGPFGAATHTITLQPGGTFAVFAPGTGWTVTAGTGDLINIANASGASAQYDIIVVGSSA